MTVDIGELELKRQALTRKLLALGDFRRGSISRTHRKCGKKNCACAQPGHQGHLQYQWTTTRGTKSEARNLRLGPQLEKYVSEVDNYQKFLGLMKELVEVCEKICDLRPVSQIEDEQELEAMKKKLQRRFARRQSKR
jgi:hypothetical protein